MQIVAQDPPRHFMDADSAAYEAKLLDCFLEQDALATQYCNGGKSGEERDRISAAMVRLHKQINCASCLLDDANIGKVGLSSLFALVC